MDKRETMILTITRVPGAAFQLSPDNTHYGYTITREDGTCLFQGAGVKPRLNVHEEFERYAAAALSKANGESGDV